MRTRSAVVTEIAVVLLVLAAWVSFATATSRLAKTSPLDSSGEMQVALPRFMQVLMAGGDRFLAANITVFRALVTDPGNQMPARFAVQAKLQGDAAWMNPRHEDNYYLAAAALAWNNRLETAQEILGSASQARTFDMLPAFFYAFNEYYFRHDPVTGSKWLRIAAEHTPSEEDKLRLNRLAANWMVKGQDRQQALKMLEAMASQSRYRSLRRQILLRAERVRHLIELDQAIIDYQKRYQELPASLELLVSSHILATLPSDPLGNGYTMDTQGKAQIKTAQKK